MKELHTDKSLYRIGTAKTDAVIITTNGMTKKDGHAVMGAGYAKEADYLFHISEALGKKLKESGNHVYYMGTFGSAENVFKVFTFPTKNNWRDPSDIKLIERSARELLALVDKAGVQHCYISKVGCTNGKLNWETDVKPVLDPILDDRFIVVIND